MAKKRKTKSPATRSRGSKTKTVTKYRKSRGMGSKFTAPLKPIAAGAIGGAGYALAGSFISTPIVKALTGGLLAFGAGFMGYTNVGAGIAGAASADLVRGMFGLNDDMEETTWVDPNSLSEDDVTIDDNGDVFALSDDGETVYLGNYYSDPELSDAFSLADSEQSVMLTPTYTS